MIISSISYKGGVGKSTVAQNLAVCLTHKGNKVCIVDADETGATTSWSGKRLDREVSPSIPVVSIHDPKSIMGNVKLLYENYDVIVIDSPPSISPIASKIMLLSHLVIVPITPKGSSDKDVTEKFLERFHEVQSQKGEEITAYIMMNQFQKNLNLHKAFHNVLKNLAEEYGVRMLDTVFSEYVAFGEVSTEGKGVYEYNHTKAKKEAVNLTNEILKISETI